MQQPACAPSNRAYSQHGIMQPVADGEFDLLSLPSDAMLCILRLLNYTDLLAVESSCRSLRRVITENDAWYHLCHNWDQEIPVDEWRKKARSGKALFRLLNTFSKLVGTWSANKLAPRGGLLFVTWGKYSLDACRVVSHSGGTIKLTRLFEILGQDDGSTRLELVTILKNKPDPLETRFAGALIWSSYLMNEFSLEFFGLGESSFPHKNEGIQHGIEKNGAPSSSEPDRSLGEALGGQRPHSDPPVDIEDGYNSLRLQLQQSLVRQAFHLVADDPRLSSQGGMFNNEEESLLQEGMTIGQRAINRLLYLVSVGNNRATTGIHVGDRGSGIQREAWQTSYRKLGVCEPSHGHDLSGLWTGVYGPHGIEIVMICYTTDSIVATKVLGDPNVPCNEITFQVSIGTESTDIPEDLQRLAATIATDPANATDIVKIYNGEGRIAGTNFRDPQWVSGQLLIDRKGSILFLWKDVNFIIQFKRLDLALLYKTQTAEGVDVFR